MQLNAVKVIAVLFLIVRFAFNGFSADPIFLTAKGNSKSRIARTRIAIAPVISFYTINTNHATRPTQKMSGILSIKEEFRLNFQHTMFFSVGAEYFVHGLNFNSYYFTPDSLQLYDGDMKYAYSLYIHELDIPFQLRISLNRENNALFSPYFAIAYHLRTMLFGSLNVNDNGESVVKKQEDINFKNPLFTQRNNPFVSLTIGVQKNNPDKNKMGFFAELGFRYGFSPYLLKDNFTPSSLYMNGSHLFLGLGIRI